MRLVARIMIIVTTLCFVGSSTLCAMPLVWCIGNDGHRAIETMLHQHGSAATDISTDDEKLGSTHQQPCSDWQLLSAAVAQHVKSCDEAPKHLTVVIAFPPLKFVAASPLASQGIASTAPRPPEWQAQLLALRSVILLI